MSSLNSHIPRPKSCGPLLNNTIAYCNREFPTLLAIEKASRNVPLLEPNKKISRSKIFKTYRAVSAQTSKDKLHNYRLECLSQYEISMIRCKNVKAWMKVCAKYGDKDQMRAASFVAQYPNVDFGMRRYPNSNKPLGDTHENVDYFQKRDITRIQQELGPSKRRAHSQDEHLSNSLYQEDDPDI